MPIDSIKARTCGGSDLGSEHDPTMWLRYALGPKLFGKFQKQFGGKKIWLPKHADSRPCRYCGYRDLIIKQLKSSGKTVAHIAEEFDLSRKHIYCILDKNERFLRSRLKTVKKSCPLLPFRPK